MPTLIVGISLPIIFYRTPTLWDAFLHYLARERYAIPERYLTTPHTSAVQPSADIQNLLNVLPGRTVELIEADSGEVIATTKTSLLGRYQFTLDDGLRTGKYQVKVDAAKPWSAVATRYCSTARACSLVGTEPVSR